MGEERRRVPRYPFVADAVVRDDSSGTTVNTRLSELSLYGCYLDMVNPLPSGTPITVKVSSSGKFLQASGKVAYAAPNLGIGVSFHHVDVHSLIVLKEWLVKAAQAKYGPASAI